MYSANFDYYRAATVSEAVALLASHPGAKLLAGGHSLLPQLKLRVAQPAALVDIGRVAELRGIRQEGGRLIIGALTTHNAVATSAVVREHCPVLAEAAALIGDQQVRNRGTIGGSIAHADPAADLPTVLLALGATVTVTGPSGSREIAAAQMYTDLFTTSLAENEILTSISVPAYGAAAAGAYAKHEHPASGYAVVGTAVVLTVSGGQVSSAHITIGGATANPVRAGAAEAALMGKALNAENIAAAAAKAAEAVTNPLSDYYASAEFRTHLATVMVKQALTAAAAKLK
ncbi:MAG: xanthine dehydrogenase family protein subunit M [Anaerolineales bacterium]|nr:xanthine dehydrogenase family protein subunit M [Anaerolineales bacterium]